MGVFLKMSTEVDGLVKKATDLAKADNYIEALAAIDEAAGLDPQNPKVWDTRGYINAREGEFEKGVLDLSKSIALRDFEPHPYYIRGDLLLKLGRLEEAAADFSRVLELCDHYRSDYYREGAHFFRADVYARLGKHAEALADCAHVRDGMQTWTDRLRTKEEIIAECKS